METFGSKRGNGRREGGDRLFEIFLDVLFAQGYGGAEVGKGVAERDHLAAETLRELANAELGKIGLR